MYVFVPLHYNLLPSAAAASAFSLPTLPSAVLFRLGAEHGRLVGLDDLVGLPGEERHLHAVTHLLHGLLATVLGLQVPVNLIMNYITNIISNIIMNYITRIMVYNGHLIRATLVSLNFFEIF